MLEIKPHFKIIATGSSGNAYSINDELLLDAGVSASKIRKATNFSIPHILITHEHGDHTQAVKTMLGYGASLYMTQGTKEALGLDDINIHIVEENKSFYIKDYEITPFKSYHDANEPVNYQIKIGTSKILYITDTKDIPYDFADLTHLLLEINYTLPTLLDNARIEPERHKYFLRTRQTHMGDTRAISWLKNQDLSKLEMLYVIHTSDGNCDIPYLKNQLSELKIPFKIAKEVLCLH